MKNLLSLLAIASVMLLWSCSSDDDGGGTDPDPEPSNETVSGVITEDLTWVSGSTITLDGRVVVDAGVTLSIEPGVVVKGEEGEGSLASVLIIAQGGTILANGTADSPIIFTSVLPSILR